ncbi:hypothetical protein CL656_05015 [bacterium]|nr:hypothetical protein [bacterium]|tara:strand:- start:2575 stop:4065 length:1491 start_codon:yes stop_codon:yes gene_type:complete
MIRNHKNKLGICFPGHFVINTFKNDKEIIFLTESDYSVLENGNRLDKKYNFENKLINLKTKVNITKIRKEINNYSTMWTRWVGTSYKHEIFREKTSILVYKIILTLESLNIKCMVFHTSVPHHYDTFCLHTACSLLNIPTIFLYPMEIGYDTSTLTGNSLLPIRHNGDIFSREPLGYIINKKDYKSEINNFIIKTLENSSNKVRVYGDSIISNLTTNFCFSLISLFYLELKYLYIKISRRKPKYFYKDYSILNKLNILFNQKEYLKLYKKYQFNTLNLKDKGPLLIIYSHYQPEATSMPEGGDFISHIDIILAIRSKGYLKKLYYKEHIGSQEYISEIAGKIVDITRVGLHRSKEYLDSLLDLECTLLDPKLRIDINHLNKSKYIPVTIGGSIALERSLLGLKTIVCGQPWFKNMPGVIHIDEIDSLEEIDPEWTIPSELIANQAFSWLDNTISNKTITNALSIGYTHKNITLENINKSKTELKLLVKALKLEYIY